MNLNAKVVEKTSKSGNKYVCVEIEITPTYTKVVLLDRAELELIKAVNTKKAM